MIVTMVQQTDKQQSKEDISNDRNGVVRSFYLYTMMVVTSNKNISLFLYVDIIRTHRTIEKVSTVSGHPTSVCLVRVRVCVYYFSTIYSKLRLFLKSMQQPRNIYKLVCTLTCIWMLFSNQALWLGFCPVGVNYHWTK